MSMKDSIRDKIRNFLEIKEPLNSSMALSGLSIPSKILSIMPGPKSTFIGAPVPVTGSPGFKPVVSSYT